MPNPYRPFYTGSHALIVGINEYRMAPKLGYAVNDATAVAEELKGRFGFPEDKLILLIDESATRQEIHRAFMRFRSSNADDRALFFFAGHGNTVEDCRGPRGYLVPVDADPDDLTSMLEMGQLLRDANFIPAKHLLLILDCCFSGLTITRNFGPGSQRFLENMLSRGARQVLTAGKADEVVADSGGPIQGHSIFTGHFLGALRGAAIKDDGILTATNVMAYTHSEVGKDPNSDQTPHFGYASGDGDFIFEAPNLLEPLPADTSARNVVVPIFTSALPEEDEMSQPNLTVVKKYLSDSKYRISLSELMMQKTRAFIGILNAMAVPEPRTLANMAAALEDISNEFAQTIALIAHYGDSNHEALIANPLKRLSENFTDRTHGGLIADYPLYFLTYVAGISALLSENYVQLGNLMSCSTKTRIGEFSPHVNWIGEISLNWRQSELFSTLPDFERRRTPVSDYLFQRLQPLIDELFYPGAQYELSFDKFECIVALMYSDIHNREHEGAGWTPVGRFGYLKKPMHDIRKEIEAMKNEWPLLKLGYFGGDYNRLIAVSNHVFSFIKKLEWW